VHAPRSVENRHRWSGGDYRGASPTYRKTAAGERSQETGELIGLGTYTLAEAGRLLGVPPDKIARWLRGHQAGKKIYAPLWRPEIDLGDDRVFLGFRDLMEVRVADAFIQQGISAQKVRAAILLAQNILGRDHPLSTDRFRTDGREIFLQVFETDEDGNERERLLNLFRWQNEFRHIIEPILKTVDFGEDGSPEPWWPAGRRAHIIVDPARSFAAPIEAESSVPTSILATAERYHGAREAAAYAVSEASVRRAVEFETSLEQRKAA
jgi:hypothetical protein